MEGHLQLPENASGIVLFAQGGGCARHSPRTQFVAEMIRQAGIGTLVLDLLVQAEEPSERMGGTPRFDIKLLTRELIAARRWLETRPETRGLKAGFCGAGTGGAAALMAAAELGKDIAAVVSRGGRPDLAKNRLAEVRSPTLLIVGDHDETVILRNEEAYARLRCEKMLRIVPGATHLFEERGRLEQVAQFSADWFGKHLESADQRYVAC